MPDGDAGWTVKEISDDAGTLACWPVMAQLRTHLAADEFVAQVRRQRRSGYRLAAAWQDEQTGIGGVTDSRKVADIRGVAGFRLMENLAWGRFLYVDDLVTDEAVRGSGAGRWLIEWLVAVARREGCEQLHLDSGVQRFAAHRFYLRSGLDITSHHFAMRLSS